MVTLQSLPTQPRYALVVIDIFSKLGDAVPMGKNCISVFNALLKICFEMVYPRSIYSDDDGACKPTVKAFFDEEGINHVITLTHANVVGRFTRT